jgi:hypothetical protein
MMERLGKEFKSLVFKTISDLKEDSHKQMNGARRSIQDLKNSETWGRNSARKLRF